MAATSLPSATKETSATPKPSAKDAPAAGPVLRFPRSSRILRAAEFRKVYDHGIRISGPLFAAFCLRRTEAGDGPRLGLTVPRAVGGAVVRNRLKRRLREAFRMHRSKIGAEWDFVLNPRKAVVSATFVEIEKALDKVIRECNSRF